jgi:sucrose-6-phosphate hydrolase SacC (GH32 family)
MNSGGGKAEAVNAYPGMPFNQQMSIPREITLRSTPAGPRLFRVPAVEIEKLRTHSTKLPTGPLAAEKNSNPLAGVTAELLDLELDITVGSAKRIVVMMRGQEIAYDVAKQALNAFASTAPLPLINGKLQLRLILDRTSIEVFGNNGVADISGVFFPDPANRKMSLAAVGGEATLTRAVAHEMRSAWPAVAGAGSD